MEDKPKLKVTVATPGSMKNSPEIEAYRNMLYAVITNTLVMEHEPGESVSAKDMLEAELEAFFADIANQNKVEFGEHGRGERKHMLAFTTVTAMEKYLARVKAVLETCRANRGPIDAAIAESLISDPVVEPIKESSGVPDPVETTPSREDSIKAGQELFNYFLDGASTIANASIRPSSCFNATVERGRTIRAEIAKAGAAYAKENLPAGQGDGIEVVAAMGIGACRATEKRLVEALAARQKEWRDGKLKEPPK